MRTAFVLLLGATLLACNGKAEKANAKSEELKVEKASHQVTDSVLIDQIIFGRYCGQCNENCSRMFRLNTTGNTSTLWADKSDNFFKNKPFKFDVDYNQKESLAIAYEIMWELPEPIRELGEGEHTVGCPDCEDECGIHVEFLWNGKRTKVRLDRDDNLPKLNEGKMYASFVDAKINELIDLIDK